MFGALESRLAAPNRARVADSIGWVGKIMHFHGYVLIAAAIVLSPLLSPASGWSAEPTTHSAKTKPVATPKPVESAKSVNPTFLAEAATAIQQASALLPQGQYAQAKVLAEKAIALIEKALGKDAVQVAEPLSILGDCLRMTGDIERGEQLQRQALTLYDRHKATDNAWYAAVLYRLADVLRMRGKNVEALAIQQRLGELSVKLHGPNNPGLAVCLKASSIQPFLAAALIIEYSPLTLYAAIGNSGKASFTTRTHPDMPARVSP